MRGNLQEAADEAAREAGKLKRAGALAWFWKFRLLEAEALLGQAEIQKAALLLKDRIPGDLESNQLEIRRLIDQADLCSKSSRRAEAITILEEVRPAATDPGLQVRIDVLEGGVLVRLERFEEAEQDLKRAYDRACNRQDAYQQASALLNLSYERKRQYRYSEATEYGLRALAIAESHGMRRVAAGANGNLGSVYTFLGDFERASDHQEKAIDLLAAIHDSGNLLIALGEQAVLSYTLNKFEKAITQYQRAFSLAQSMNNNSDAARMAGSIAAAFIELNRWDKAEEWNERARDLVAPESRSARYVVFNAARIAYGRGRSEQAIQMCEDLVRRPDLPPDLLWDTHAYLGEGFAARGRFAEAYSEFRAALLAIDKTRGEVRSPALQMTFLSRLITFHQDYVDMLVDRNDDAGALRTAESSRARVLAERLGRDVARPQAIDIPHLTALARETNTSIISFWLAPKRSFAWLIDKTGVQRFLLPPSGDIEPLVTAYRNVVEHSLQDPIASNDPNGPKLWNALLRDIAPRIPKGSRVVVIPDGPLHRLNLETLPAPSPQPHYWIEDVALAVAPSLTIAASKPAPVRQRSASLLLIGAPEYAGTDFKPLENAAPEIRDIQKRFLGTTQDVRVGPQATPDAYRNSQPARFSLIHFAAHAEASNENPLESAVILSHQGDAYKLYARDVIDQPIQADLVTISGCKSAGVRAYAGEGLIGFSWAFLHAGARAVVAGLWEASDASTEPLMNEFYGAIASGEPPTTAMRHAKLTLMRQAAYSKPFYWAPFQVYIRSVYK